jgi:CRP-like cAMP-binding protein
VEVLDDSGKVLATLGDGDCFGEIALLIHTPRTATVRAKTGCDLVALDKTGFSRILRDYPQFADSVLQIARDRYDLNIQAETLLSDAARH